MTHQIVPVEREEYEAMKRDAERYRHWRDVMVTPSLLLSGQIKLFCYADKWISDGTEESFRKSVDAAVDDSISAADTARMAAGFGEALALTEKAVVDDAP